MMNIFLFVFKSDSCLCLRVIETVVISSSSVLLRGLKKIDNLKYFTRHKKKLEFGAS